MHELRDDRAEAVALAPASVGNVGVGFDILGHAVAGAADRVIVRRGAEPGVRVVEISGCVTDLPKSARNNTASVAVLEMVRQLGLGAVGLEIILHKGIPLASGMGGSAASAVGAVAALNELLAERLPTPELYPFALAGESVTTGGAVPGDNVAASLLGGLTLCHPQPGTLPVRLPVPDTIWCALVHPEFQISTREARVILPEEFPLKTVVSQSANLAGLLAGCQSGNLDQIARSLQDLLIEPCRSPLIPGFADVKNAALQAGALGCSISGAGPSLFAWFSGDADADAGAAAMVAAFGRHAIAATFLCSPVNCPGVQVL